jgi:pseudoazurin
MDARKLLLAAAAFAFTLAPAMAAEHEIKMLNKGDAGAMVFEPALLHIAPGDTVTFIATDKSHNAETINGMLPDGAAPFKGKVNEEIVVTFDVPGVYGIKCLPHYAMGMIGLIVVGDEAANLDEARAVKHPGKAKDRFNDVYAELDAQ